MKLKDIEVVKWSQVSAQFQHAFPELHADFDRLFKKTSARFYLARYPFGMNVVENGVLQIPYEGKLTSIDSPDLPDDIRSELHYPHVGIPISAVLKGSLEAYINLPNHLIPLRILKAGTIYSTNTLFHKERTTHIIDTAYSYMSGSRSMLILPKISHEQYNERLAKHYTIDKQYLCPKTFTEQWDLFRELIHSPEFKSDWETEVLLFPKSTYDLIDQDVELRQTCADIFIRYNFFNISQVMYDLVWSMFFEKLSSSIKNAPFILETVKHLMKICISEAPGYVPVVNEDQGPVKELMDIFLNVYRIRYYQPAFMEVAYFNRHDPIYYSMQKHTFFCNIPEKGGANRTIDELIAIKRLILSFKQFVLEGKFPFSLENTFLFKALQEVEFDFYHPQGTNELNTDIEAMIKEDPRFMALIQGIPYDKALDFPMHSLFFNGCIRVRPSKKALKPSMKDLLDPMKMGSFRLDRE